jgi:hypothetical protein
LGAGYTLGAGWVYKVEFWTLQKEFFWKKFPITLSETCWGVSHMWTWFKSKSRLQLKSQGVEKIGGGKNRRRKKMDF